MTQRRHKRIGSYEILAPLGAGGMGDVYRARDTKLGRDVAIKSLPLHFTNDRERTDRLAREARLLAALNHPNIAAIYGLEESEDGTALVLELVEGPTLAERLKQGPVKLTEALSIAQQIADALDAAHERGIVHRDLKPSNIVLQPRSIGAQDDARVKVLDFGIAKLVHGDGSADASAVTQSVTDEGRVIGTPGYMSPEQARGQATDKRTDVWAFGCVLFEMLTGRAAFSRDTTSDTFVSILEHEPDWTALPRNTPSFVRALLKRCLRKEPRKRLHDIADARIALEEPEDDPIAVPSIR